MQPYKLAADFAGTGFIPYLSSISTAIPSFWAVTLFVFWIVVNAASYFAILKTTGRKRFWHTFVAVTFVFFLISLLIASMNGTNGIIFLSGYWVAWYILWTVLGWILLENYK
jgi:hypothetical protein